MKRLWELMGTWEGQCMIFALTTVLGFVLGVLGVFEPIFNLF
jgi:hypothetical protein